MMMGTKDVEGDCYSSSNLDSTASAVENSRPCDRYRQSELSTVTNNHLVNQHHYRLTSSSSITGYHHGELAASSPQTLSPASPSGVTTANTDCVFSCTSPSHALKSRGQGVGGGVNRKHTTPIPSVKLPEYPWVDDTPGVKRFNEANDIKDKKGKVNCLKQICSDWLWRWTNYDNFV